MSHEIGKFDEQHGRAQAWHGLTIVNPTLKLSDSEFVLRRLDAIAFPANFSYPESYGKLKGQRVKADAVIYGTDFESEEGEGEEVKTKKSRSVACLFTSGGTMPEGKIMPVGLPYNPGSYEPIYNREMVDLISTALAECGLPDDVESAGVLKNRQLSFITIRLPGEETMKINEREFVNYLNLQNSFNKQSCLMMNYSNVCTVCANTFGANEATGGWRGKHTPGIRLKLEGLPKIIKAALTQAQSFRNDFLKLSAVSLDAEQNRALCLSFLAGEKQASTQAINTSERLTTIFSCKSVGNNGQNLGDTFSAFTDYFTHESSGGEEKEASKRWKQVLSSEYGSGAVTKRRAMNYLLACVGESGKESELFKSQIKCGLALLKEYNAAK